MTSTFTTNKGLEEPANGDYVSNWQVPVNANWTAIDVCFGGLATFNAVGATGVVAVTKAQYQPPIWTITGAITANINYQLPAGVGGRWSVYNNTTGAFTITVSSATGGGSSVVIPQGQRLAIASDGTNVTADSTVLPTTGAVTWTGSQTIKASNSTTITNYLLLTPTDFGVGKPQLFFQKDSVANNWIFGSFDGSGSGPISFNFSNVTFNSPVTTGNLTTGSITASANITSKGVIEAFGTSLGAIQLIPGDSTHTGYLGFFDASNNRQGYIGYATTPNGTIQITNDKGTGFQIQGGTLTCAGDITANSDRKLKTDIKPIVGAREMVRAMKGRRFVWKADGVASIGFIAQEVAAIVPEMVHETVQGDQTVMAVAYDKAAPILIEALKETMAEVDRLHDEVAKLKRRGLLMAIWATLGFGG